LNKLRAKALPPDFDHILSQMMKPNAMKNGAAMAARDPVVSLSLILI
jgi:hypothetical protein